MRINITIAMIFINFDVPEIVFVRKSNDLSNYRRYRTTVCIVYFD